MQKDKHRPLKRISVMEHDTNYQGYAFLFMFPYEFTKSVPLIDLDIFGSKHSLVQLCNN